MRILGFYIGGHDSNITLIDNNGNAQYYKLERIIQSKHKKGTLGWVKSICDSKKFVPDIICYSDGNRNDLGICDEGSLVERVNPIPGLFDTETYCIDHHYAHILSAWPIIDNKNDYQRGICIDGRGDHQIKCSVINNPLDIKSAKIIYKSKTDSFCLAFNRIGRYMGLKGGELDYAGKIMGAHAYGHVDMEFSKKLKDNYKTNGVMALLEVKYQNKSPSEICSNKDEQFYEWLATIHYTFGDLIKDIFANYGSPSTIYSGGCAQNTVYNELLRKDYKLTIPPHCYDGGISIGCVFYAASLKGEELKWEEFPFSHGDNTLEYADEKTIEKVCSLLKIGKIVGWCQGKAEIGPRALGHRSILMNPMIPNGKDILNNRVKKREYWRPFAASILQSDVKQITGESESFPFMLHAVKVNDQYHDILKSVIHVDNTCRFQTVDDNLSCLSSYYKLIKAFKDQTGIPGLLNTSYNMGGNPIADSYEDIINAYKNMDIDSVCIGNEVYIK